MSQVEIVALWVGLMAGVASIVLSAVAILFARDVDRRSERVSNQTIQSLQRIESTVAQLSEDTRDLIKVAWDRLLGQVGASAPQPSDIGAEIASGLIAELRASLRDLTESENLGGATVSEVNRVVRAVEEQLVRPGHDDRTGSHTAAVLQTGAFETVVESVKLLDPVAVELLRALEAGKAHLSWKMYRELSRNPEIESALLSLRTKGLVVPLEGAEDGSGDPVYWFPPWFYDVIGPALVFCGREYPEIRETIVAALNSVGYG